MLRSFEVEREFGAAIQGRFPGLIVADEISDQAVLIVDIRCAQGLTMSHLASALRVAGRGGIRSVVLTLAGASPTILPLGAVLNLVEHEVAIKIDLRVERVVRALG